MKIKNPVGKQGENQAAHYLTQKGYRIIEMNFRKNYTEIDIIAVQPTQTLRQARGLNMKTNDETLVFVEVKTRVSDSYGRPFEAITRSKISNLVRTAQLYSKMHPHLPQSMRIDAIGVTMDKNGVVEDIEHVENISGF